MLIIVIQYRSTSSNVVNQYSSIQRIYEIIERKLKLLFYVDHHHPTSFNNIHRYPLIEYKKLEKGN